MESGSCPACMGPTGPAVISNRQAGSFKESCSKGWALNSSETHWPTFPCGPFIYQEMKLVTGFLTLPNLTDEIRFLPEFRRSFNSLLVSGTSWLGPRGRPSVPGSEEPRRAGAAGGGALTSREPRPCSGSGATSIDRKRWFWGTWLLYFAGYLRLSNASVSFTGLVFSIFKNEGLYTWCESPYWQHNLVT